MSYLPQLLTISGVLLLGCISPGPDFLAVSSHALVSRRAGIGVALGVTTGCLIWAALAVFGLGALLHTMPWLETAIRIAGALYLAWLGAKLLRSAAGPTKQTTGYPLQASQNRGAFLRGFLVNISNPKAAAFFGSLFLSVLPAGTPLWVHGATIPITGSIAILWFTLVALLFSAPQARAGFARASRPVNAAMGVALIALGLKLAAGR